MDKRGTVWQNQPPCPNNTDYSGRVYSPAFFCPDAEVGSTMWHDLWVALALVMVIEGIVPFLSPRATKGMMLTVVEMEDKSLRTGGLVSMILGVLALYLVN